MSKIRPAFHVDYVSLFKYCVTGSAIVIIASLVLFFTKGLNYGVDFRGGAEIQVRFKDVIDTSKLRNSLEAAKVPVSSVQAIGENGNEVLLKVQSGKEDLNTASTQVGKVLADTYGQDRFEVLKNDIVGPKAGAQLRTAGFKAMAWAMLAIMIYLALRFDFKYAPGAIIALFHDVTIIVGVYILTQKEFSLQTVAALLAVIGYSVNDTVIIYDRVRELEVESPGSSLSDVVNVGVNETMKRTIITSTTVFIVCMVMWLMGGGVIQDFFFALTVGTVVGTYSSIFIASPITIALDSVNKKKMAQNGAKAKAT